METLMDINTNIYTMSLEDQVAAIAMEFNLTGYPPGLYFLKIAGEKESITKKIIIK